MPSLPGSLGEETESNPPEACFGEDRDLPVPSSHRATQRVERTAVKNTHLKERSPVDHSIWSSLGEDLVEAGHEPTPKGIKTVLGPVLGSYGT